MEKSGSNFTLTLTAAPVGAKIEEFELTLDELIIRHMSWLASAGRSGKQINFSNVDMRQGPGLAAKRLTAIKATDTTFAEMDMRGIEMQSAQLEKCDFRKCKLNVSDLRAANFRCSIFNWADLSKANLNPLYFRKPDGFEYHIPCNFSQTSMRHVVFSGARLRHAVFSGADLVDADFSNCDLRNADFTGANTAGAIFDGAILEGALLERP